MEILNNITENIGDLGAVAEGLNPAEELTGGVADTATNITESTGGITDSISALFN